MRTQLAEDVRALLARLRQSPKDTDTWCVLADCLTEHGDDRGALIALQQRAAAPGLANDEADALRRQIEALEGSCRPKWLSGLLVPGGVEFAWHHGFVTEVSLRWDAETLPFLQALLAHPTGTLLTALNLRYKRIGAEGARALASSEHLRALTSLDLGYNDLGDEGARALASSENLRALTALALSGNHIGDEGARALASSENLRALTVLNL